MSQATLPPWLLRDLKQIQQRVAQDNLHHGLLFIGKDGSGTALLAAHAAHYLLCVNPSKDAPCGKCQSCLLFEAGTHPDFYVVEAEKSIGVDLIREHIDKLQAKSHLSKRKVLMIPQAQYMTEAASNALLKTLEEPGQDTYLMLMVPRTKALLATIVSRCERLSIASPDPVESKQWLHQQGVSYSDEFFQLYHEEPYTLLELVKRIEQPIKALDEQIDDMLAGKLSPLALAQSLLGIELDPLKRIMLWCKRPKSAELSEQYWRIYQSCLDNARAYAHSSTNKELILATLLQEIKYSLR
jgi:DNA polymerase-3 subunit delta'